MSILDTILSFLPNISKPAGTLSLRQKFKWTAIILTIYFILFNTPAFGVSIAALNQPQIQLISIIFAARIGSIISVGISPIVLAGLVLQALTSTELLKIDMNSNEGKAKFQGLQKLAAIIIALVDAYFFTVTGYVPLANKAFFWIVVFQLALGAIVVIFLDEISTKYGITSGINLFIASGVAYAIVAGTFNIIFSEAWSAIQAGGASALPNALLAFGPLLFSILVFFVSIYAYDIKVELPVVLGNYRGAGGRLPLSFLYVSVLPVILAVSFELSLTVWFRFLSGVSGNFANLARFIAYYVPNPAANANLVLQGGLLYLISPVPVLPYGAQYGGIGGYGPYFNYLATQSSRLYLPTSGFILIPEWFHIIIYTLSLVILCIVFGRFWVELTNQNPKALAGQLQDSGWQIPGFRRDPRIIEGVLNKYIPALTVLSSAFVGLLAALATLTGAVGTGVGILLTVGILYNINQQLERENLLQAYPGLNKMLS